MSLTHCLAALHQRGLNAALDRHGPACATPLTRRLWVGVAGPRTAVGHASAASPVTASTAAVHRRPLLPSAPGDLRRPGGRPGRQPGKQANDPASPGRPGAHHARPGPPVGLRHPNPGACRRQIGRGVRRHPSGPGARHLRSGPGARRRPRTGAAPGARVRRPSGGTPSPHFPRIGGASSGRNRGSAAKPGTAAPARPAAAAALRQAATTRGTGRRRQ